MELRNRELTDEEFLKIRKEVLTQWPTGKEIEDIDECIEYQRQIPDWKCSPLKAERAEKEGKIRIMPGTGLATVEQVVEHIKALDDIATDWCLHPDTYTRSHRFHLVQGGIDRSRKEGRSVLNGYPVVHHGAKATRVLAENTNGSLGFNVSNADTRLQAEMVLAGGITECNAHSLHDVAQHHRDGLLDQKIPYAQYNAKLVAYYTKRGAPISAMLPGNWMGWDMPSFRIAENLLEGLLTAEQGVKYIVPSLGLTMNLVQDVAAYHVLRRVYRDYLDRAGHGDVKVFPRSDSWLGDWPMLLGRATAILTWTVIIPILAGVNNLSLKSVDEGVSIPTPEGNRLTLNNARQIVQIMGNQRLPDSEELRLEERMLELEVRATVDKVLELGDGDVAVGMVKAVDYGVLDTIFSPWKYIKGKVLVVRDKSGAIRYLEHGNIPLPKEVIDYHRQRIAEREKAEGSKADMEMVIEHVTRVTKPFDSSTF